MKTKRSFYLSAMALPAVLALVLLPSTAIGATYLSYDFNSDTVGVTPAETANFDISPNDADADKGVIVIDGTSSQASPLDGQSLYIYDLVDSSNARYVADINGGANVSSAQVEFDFAVNPAITGAASDTEINFTVGMGDVSLTSSSRRAFEFRILQDGGLDLRAEGVSTEIGTFSTGETHHMSVLLNSDDAAGLDYDIANLGAGTIASNSFHIYLDGVKLGEYGFFLDPSDAAVAYNTGVADLGAVAFYQDTGNTGGLIIDNLLVADVGYAAGGEEPVVEVNNIFSSLDFEDDTAGSLPTVENSKFSPSSPGAINGSIVIDGSSDPANPFEGQSLYAYDFGTVSGNSTHARYNFNGGANVSEVRVDFDFRPMPVVDPTDGDSGIQIAVGRAGFTESLNNSDFRPFRLNLFNDGTLSFDSLLPNADPELANNSDLGTYDLNASSHITMLINSHDSQSTAYDLDGLGAGTLAPNTVHVFLDGTNLGEFDFFVTPDPTNAPHIVFNAEDKDLGQIAIFQDTNSKGAMAFDNIVIKRVIDITGPPSAPTELVLTQANPLTMELSWTDNSDNETGFVIERAPSGSDEFVVVGTANADATNFTDEGLDAETEYKYRVRATNGYDSDFTNELVASTTVQLAPIVIDSSFDDFILSGFTSMLSVDAAGQATLTYQWYLGESGDVSNPISGATTAEIESPILTEDTSIWVRVSNSEGSADSETFVVEVHVPAVILVESSGELESAISAALPGDVIEIANGEYSDLEIEFTGSGLEGMPITIRAAEKGQVLLTGSSTLRIGGDWLVVENLVFQGEYTGGDDTIIEFKTSRDANDCVLRGIAILDYVPTNGDRTFWVALHGERNRVTDCMFKGHDVSGVTVVVWLDGQPNDHRIDHNHFRDRIDGNENGWESIRIGTSDRSLSDSNSLVEFNLFENVNGEIEIISNKSGGNIYRHNTFLNSQGTLTLRHGNGCLVDSNYFLGGFNESTGGIRVHGEDHIIINNYIEGTRERGDAAIALAAGQASPRLSDHQTAHRALVAFNTIYDVQGLHIGVGVGFGGFSNDTSAVRDTNPVGIVIANNIFHAGSYTSGTIVDGENPDEQSWAGNVIFGRSIGGDLTDGFTTVDPELILDEVTGISRPSATSPVINLADDLFDDLDLDIDGQDREGIPDVGADEVNASGVAIISGPITAAEVGPDYISANGVLIVNRLANQSIRAKVTPDSGTIIAGFVVTGSESKRMLIRGIGPQLADFDVTGTVSDPVLVVYDEAGVEILRNDDWGTNVGSDAQRLDIAVTAVGAFPLDSGSTDAALVHDFAPGVYTAHVTSKDGSMGEALLEIYDVSGDNSLVNQSARANICDDVEQCITGFSIEGVPGEGQTVLLRAVGPSLADFNVEGFVSDVQLNEAASRHLE